MTHKGKEGKCAGVGGVGGGFWGAEELAGVRDEI